MSADSLAFVLPAWADRIPYGLQFLGLVLSLVGLWNLGRISRLVGALLLALLRLERRP